MKQFEQNIAGFQYSAFPLTSSDATTLWPIMAELVADMKPKEGEDRLAFGNRMASELTKALMRRPKTSTKLSKKFAEKCFVEINGKKELLKDELDLHFAGRGFAHMQWLAWQVQANFFGS